MRFRNESLSTGSLLAHFDPGDRRKNRSILFLVEGAADISPLALVEQVCRQYIQHKGFAGFEWHAVPDQGQLTAVDPWLDGSRMKRLEVREFAGLTRDELQGLLHPALDRLAQGDPELFPSAGGAVGAPARGIQFLDRERDIEAISAWIREGKDILLLAPRRSGKTSLLLRLMSFLEEEYSAVYLNLERDQSATDMAARLFTIATGEKFRPAQRQAEERGWESLFAEGLTFIQSTRQKPIVLFLDELVSLLQHLRDSSSDEGRHAREAVAFLTGLSRVAHGARARLVIAGSDSLPEFIHESLGLSDSDIPPPFSRLTLYSLPSLAVPSLHVELRRVLMGTGVVPENSEVAWLVENVDLAVPYPALRFLDQLASRLRSVARLDRVGLAQELDNFLDQTDAFKEFEEHLRRKGEQVAGARTAAGDALDLVAEAPLDEGVPTKSVQARIEERVAGHGDRLFAWLKETFPLMSEGDRTMFASRLFHRWWSRQLPTRGEAG
jgi:energy-coupling factor transporter ATP-binding protein EcfA2